MKKMKIVVALVSLAFAASSASAAWAPASGWTSVDPWQFTYAPESGHWYGLSVVGLWGDAQTDAVQAGNAVSASSAISGAWIGSLVKIDDADENAWLRDTFFDDDGAGPDTVPGLNGKLGQNEWGDIPHLWIGATAFAPKDVSDPDQWNWNDGSPLSAGYTNWGGGEPSAHPQEQWAAIRQDAGGTWNNYETSIWFDSYGYGNIQGIIELTPVTSSIPAPGAFLIAGIGSACVGFLRRRKAV